MTETGTPNLLHTKSFKKYTEEYAKDVVDFIRDWAATEPLQAFHEDNSLVKVTGSQEQILGLLAILKDKFGYIPPEELEEKD